MKQFSGRVSMVLWESYVPTYICRAAVLFEIFFFPTRQAVSILPIPKFSFVRFPHLISEEFSVNNIFSLGVRHCVTFTETNLQWKGCKNVENKWGNNSCVRIGFLRVEKRAQLAVGNCEAYLNFILNALLYRKNMINNFKVLVLQWHSSSIFRWETIISLVGRYMISFLLKAERLQRAEDRESSHFCIQIQKKTNEKSLLGQ